MNKQDCDKAVVLLNFHFCENYFFLYLIFKVILIIMYFAGFPINNAVFVCFILF